jgi:RNA-binding protein 5/10
MITSLPSYADRDILNILLAQQGFHPIDIRVVRRNTDSGNIRVFGFVEFSDGTQAQAWMNYNNGFVKFEDGFTAKLEYSREDSAAYAERRAAFSAHGGPASGASDWTCAKCTINNFNRRNACFKCGTSRDESDAMEAKGYGMVGVAPCDTLLIRELPATVTEESVRSSLSRYTNLLVLRVHIATSRRYALIQLKTVEDASYLLTTFNKVIPYIDNCAVIVTFARMSLNQIVIADNVNALKSQIGLSSAHMHEDPTNSAAQLAQNAIQIAQMGRQLAGSSIPESVQSISTPVGVFPIYPQPNPDALQYEPSSTYYYDSTTGFYFDAKTQYYYNSKTNQWMFWCAKYSTYIPCDGGDAEMKQRLQEESRAHSNGPVFNQPTNTAATGVTNEDPTLQTEASNTAQEETTTKEAEKGKKKKKKEEDDANKPKSAQDIQKEMVKWAKRQEKIKMTFKPTDSKDKEPSAGGSQTSAEESSRPKVCPLKALQSFD